MAEIVLKAMETTTLMYRGRQFSISDVPITLSPIQKPYPPLWFGTTKPETSRWAAENSINIACVGRSNAIRAYPLGACSAAPAYARWFKTFTLLSRISNLPPPPNLPESFEQALDGGFYLVGSPSTVRETLKSQVVEAGVTYVMCQLAFGDSLHRSKRSRPCDRPSFPISRGKCQISCKVSIIEDSAAGAFDFMSIVKTGIGSVAPVRKRLSPHRKKF